VGAEAEVEGVKDHRANVHIVVVGLHVCVYVRVCVHVSVCVCVCAQTLALQCSQPALTLVSAESDTWKSGAVAMQERTRMSALRGGAEERHSARSSRSMGQCSWG